MIRITLGRVVTALVLLAGSAAIVWSFLPRPVPIETAVVTKGRFVATVNEDGKTRIRERYVVSAPLTGQLTRIRLKAGDRIAAGDAIATIVPSPVPFLDPRSRREAEERLGALEAAREHAKAIVDRTRAQSGQAEAELARTRSLAQRGASTTQSLERAELAARVADRELRAAQFRDHAAEHELEQARALLARYRNDAAKVSDVWNVEAPVPGLILKVAQESETIIQAGATLVEIGDPGDLEIVVDVLSTDAVEIRAGAQVIIDRWGGSRTLSGRVRRIEPTAFTRISTLGVEEQRVNVIVDISSPREQWDALGDAFQVDASIIVFTLEDATIVPTGALFRRGEAWYVYVVDDGRALEREVRLLRRSGRLAAVAAGVTADERVIVYPSDRIAAGARVEHR